MWTMTFALSNTLKWFFFAIDDYRALFKARSRSFTFTFSRSFRFITFRFITSFRRSIRFINLNKNRSFSSFSFSSFSSLVHVTS